MNLRKVSMIMVDSQGARGVAKVHLECIPRVGELIRFGKSVGGAAMWEVTGVSYYVGVDEERVDVISDIEEIALVVKPVG